MNSNLPVRVALSLGLACTLLVLIPSLAFGQPVPDPPVDFDVEMRGVPWEGLDPEGDHADDSLSGDEGDGGYVLNDTAAPSDARRSRKSKSAWLGPYSQRPIVVPKGHGRVYGGLDIPRVAEDFGERVNMSLKAQFAVIPKLEIGFGQFSDPFSDAGGPMGIYCFTGDDVCVYSYAMDEQTKYRGARAVAGGPSAINLYDDDGDIDLISWIGPAFIRYQVNEFLVIHGSLTIPIHEFVMRYALLQGGVEFKYRLSDKAALVGHAKLSTNPDLSYVHMPLRIGVAADLADKLFGQVDLGFNWRWFRYVGLFQDDQVQLFSGGWGGDPSDFEFDADFLSIPFRILLGYSALKELDLTLAFSFGSLKDKMFENLLFQLGGSYSF